MTNARDRNRAARGYLPGSIPFFDRRVLHPPPRYLPFREYRHRFSDIFRALRTFPVVVVARTVADWKTLADRRRYSRDIGTTQQVDRVSE